MIINKLYTAVLQIFQDEELKVITKLLAYNSRNQGRSYLYARYAHAYLKKSRVKN